MPSFTCSHISSSLKQAMVVRTSQDCLSQGLMVGRVLRTDPKENAGAQIFVSHDVGEAERQPQSHLLCDAASGSGLSSSLPRT